MLLRSKRLPKTERFASSEKALRASFGTFDSLSTYLGFLGKRFHWDSRCRRRATLRGPVIASLELSRDRKAILQLYAIEVSAYPLEAVREFEAEVVPQLRTWLANRLEEPSSAVLRCEQVIVEWTNSEHHNHVVRYL
jgi:hypothetical protein